MKTVFPDRTERIAWLLLACLLPFSVALRFVSLSQPLLEPHPVRHLMTAISTQMLATGQGSFWRYHFPDPRLSNLVFEFPVYQWIVAQGIRTGVGLEVASRLVTLAFFFGGAGLLWLILRRHLGRGSAAWGTLLYVLSPYNTVYSRSGLLDFTFVFFLLGLVWATGEFVARSEKRIGWWMALTLSGSVAALMKANMWAVPALFLCGYIAVGFFGKRLTFRTTAALAASFLLQAGLALAWTRWAMEVRGEAPGVPQPSWYLGGLSMRWEAYRWKQILSPIFRVMLHDWMIVPFFAGLFVAKSRGVARAAAAMVAIAVVVFFHVHSVHDYYLIDSSPFIFVIVAAGMPALFQLPPRARAVVLAGMGLALLSRAPKLPLYFAPFFEDYRPKIAHALALNELTHPEDLLFIHGGNQDVYTLFVYARRSTMPVEAARVLANQPTADVGLSPTWYVTRVGQEPSALLALRAEPTIIELPGGFRAYRARK